MKMMATQIDKVVSISGGVDSSAMALLLHERGEDFELLFLDTGAEFPETYATVMRLAGLLSKRLHVVSNGTFFQRLAEKDFLIPSPFRRWCTGELKIQPSLEFCRRNNVGVLYIGYRVDEEERVKKAMRKPRWNERYPLYEMGIDKKKAFEICEAYGIVNPIYRWRSGVGCFCCPFQRISDWRGLLENHPELFAIAEEVEKRNGWTFGKNFTLAEIRKGGIQKSLF